MAGILVMSPNCPRCQEVFQFIHGNPELARLITYHDVTRQPIPLEYKKHITRVPTLITRQRAIIVGQQDILSWLNSLIPNRIENCEIGSGSCSMTGLDGSSDDDGFFTIDRFNQSLMPILSKEMQERIDRDPKSAALEYNPRVI